MFTTLTTTLRSRLIPAAAMTVAVTAMATFGAGHAAAATITDPASTVHATSEAMIVSEGSSGMTLHISNNSNETMSLVSSDNPYGSWQQRPSDIAAHSSIDVSDYSNNIEGADICLTYKMPDGTLIDLQGKVPLAGSNWVVARSSTDHYTTKAPFASGYHPTFNIDINNA